MKCLSMQKLKVCLFVYTQFWGNFRGFFFQLLLNFILQFQHQKNNFIFLNFKKLCFHVQLTSDHSFIWFWCIFRGFFFFKLPPNFILQFQHQKNNFIFLNFKQLYSYVQFTSNHSFMWFWCIFRGFF